MGWFTYVGRIINIVNIFGAKVNFGAISTNRSRTHGSCDVTKSHNTSQSGKSTFSLVVKIPVDRGWSGMHQKIEMLPILAILTRCDWYRPGQTGMLVSGRSHIS